MSRRDQAKGGAAKPIGGKRDVVVSGNYDQAFAVNQ